jgi:hypothetical protein
MRARITTNGWTARRRRSSAGIGGLAALATAIAGATIASAGPAVSAPPTGDCAVPYPVADLVAGDAVTGKTVSTGTTIEPFTGSVLGVIEDGIAPDLDMVMVRLTSPEIDRVGGIWQGMSGSPVYAGDGRLIGAVAYGLSFGPSPVAGITPFAEMDNYMATAAKVLVDRGQARTLARAAGVTTSQAAQGFSQLRIPYGVSGVSGARLAKMPARPYRDTKLATSGATIDAAGPGADTMTAGGNVAASLAYGDITQGGVGTVTSVCGSRVVAFGHPLAFFGTTTLALHPASAVYVQEDTVGPPFKVANFGPRVGTITDDHLSGISGTFDVIAPTMAVTSSLTYGAKSRVGRTDVAAPIAAADTTAIQLLANHDRLLDGITKGSELQSWTITGAKPDGSPFTLARTDRYTSSDLAFEVPFDVADAVYMLGTFEGVRIDAVSVNGTVVKDARTWSLTKLQAKQGGKWKSIKAGGRIDAKAGKKLRLKAVLTSPLGERAVRVKVPVPGRAAGGGFLAVTGGADYFSEGDFSEDEGGFFASFSSVDDYLASQRSTVRNDAVAVDLFVEGRRSTKTRQGVSAPQDRVVTGYKEYRVRIR